MSRTTPDEVATVIDVDTTAVPDLQPFIDVASELVTECCSAAGYTEQRLTMIETWLAAHFYSMKDRQVTSEGVSGVSQSYESNVGQALFFTRHGQQAMLLDTAGGLAALSKKTETGSARKVGVTWLGTTET
jgi:hypothetical protein